MPNVGNLLGHSHTRLQRQASSALVSTSYVGVEVELEEVGNANWELDYWNVERDGSLRRNGLEFNFREPLFGVDIIAALDELERGMAMYGERFPLGTVIDDNTSVHVHVDCRDLDTEQLHNFILTAILFEQVLFKYAAPERENNIFCLPLTRAEDELSVAGRIAGTLTENSSDGLRMYSSEAAKYSSINLSALHEFGSIEFRAHKGEWRKDPLLRWTNILLRLKESAKESIITKDTYYNAVFNTHPRSLLNNVFGEELASHLYNTDIDRQLTTGAKLINEILEMATRSIDSFTTIEEGSLLSKYLETTGTDISSTRSADTAVSDFLRFMSDQRERENMSAGRAYQLRRAT